MKDSLSFFTDAEPVPPELLLSAMRNTLFAWSLFFYISLISALTALSHLLLGDKSW